MASNTSVTYTASRDPLAASSQLLSGAAAVLTSPSAPAARQAAQITKIYRQSSTLFLTRRLPESLSTILPVITPPTPAADEAAHTNGTAALPFELASPVARASRTTRIKVWSLYLTILNAVVELDADEGKQAFGTAEWRALVAKVRNGDVWNEVVQNGYGGVEGNVDADVVINLATLLLAHAPTQIVNQQKLEAYLASASRPNLDLAAHFDTDPHDPRAAFRRAHSQPSHGTDTPRDLNARVKILELYTLHVLLRNNEWEYAREFITVSEVLDEERREAFLQALQSLREEHEAAEHRQRAAEQAQEEQLQREKEEARRKQAEDALRLERQKLEQERMLLEQERLSQRANSEVDYGIDDVTWGIKSKRGADARPRSSQGEATSSSRARTKKPTAATSAPAAKKAVAAPPTFLKRAELLATNLQQVLAHMALSLRANPLRLLRFLAFIVGLLAVLARRDLRERLRRVLGASWDKVRATVGMGVKVSYI